MLSNLLQQHLVLQHVASFEISTLLSADFEKVRLLLKAGFSGKLIVHLHSSIDMRCWYWMTQA
jgi:hypothetical protein